MFSFAFNFWVHFALRTQSMRLAKIVLKWWQLAHDWFKIFFIHWSKKTAFSRCKGLIKHVFSVVFVCEKSFQRLNNLRVIYFRRVSFLTKNEFRNTFFSFTKKNFNLLALRIQLKANTPIGSIMNFVFALLRMHSLQNPNLSRFLQARKAIIKTYSLQIYNRLWWFIIF